MDTMNRFMEKLDSYGDRIAFTWYERNGRKIEKTYREFYVDVIEKKEVSPHIRGENTYDTAVSILASMVNNNCMVLYGPSDEEIPLGAGGGGRKKESEDESKMGGEAILFTSGTSGKKKAVRLSISSLLLNAAEANGRIDDYGSRFIPLPFYHAYGLTCGLLSGLMKGSRLIISSDVKYMMRDMELSECTGMICVPSLLPLIVKMRREGKLSSLRVVTCGGAPADEYRLKEIEEEGIEAVLGYGMTECSPLICSNSNISRDHDNAGYPLPSAQVRVNALTGEIEVRGPMVMKGYLDYDNVNVFNPGGWFKTGDLGYIRDGRIYITGRLKDILVMDNGEKIGCDVLEGMVMNRLGEIKAEFEGGECITMKVKGMDLDRKKVEIAVASINTELPENIYIGRIVYDL